MAVTIVKKICQYCGAPMDVPLKIHNAGGGKFCNKECFDNYQRGRKNGRRKPRKTLICAYCNKEFEIEPHQEKLNKKYCSSGCYIAHKKEKSLDKKCKNRSKIYTHVFICRICGKETTVKSRNKYQPNTCGSTECIRLSQKGKHGGKKVDDVIVNCIICGNEIAIRPHNLNKNKLGNVCSSECKRKLLLNTNVTLKKKGNTSICEYCGEEFLCIPSMVNHRRFCSRKCSTNYHRGENNTAWKGGVSFEPYCEKFNEDLKERVREFWGRKCAICGKLEKDNTKGYKLSVHHVESNKNTCCDDSAWLFAPLCMSCHGKMQFYEEEWMEYLTDVINNRMGGKCFYTKEEYKEVLSSK